MACSKECNKQKSAVLSAFAIALACLTAATIIVVYKWSAPCGTAFWVSLLFLCIVAAMILGANRNFESYRRCMGYPPDPCADRASNIYKLFAATFIMIGALIVYYFIAAIASGAACFIPIIGPGVSVIISAIAAVILSVWLIAFTTLIIILFRAFEAYSRCREIHCSNINGETPEDPPIMDDPPPGTVVN